MTLSIILVIELTSKKRRGLMIGLMNSGYTSGVSLGAVIAGALVSHTGWVRSLVVFENVKLMLCIAVYYVDSNSNGASSWHWCIFEYSSYLYGWETELESSKHFSEVGEGRLSWSNHLGE